MLRDLLIALSLANLCGFRIWQELLNGKLAFYGKSAPTEIVIAALLNVLLLGTVFFAGATLARRSGRAALWSAARWMFLLVILANLRFGRLAFDFFDRAGWLGVTAWIVLLGLVLAVLAIWGQRIAHGAALLLLLASPFVLVTASRGMWLLYRVLHMNFNDHPAAQGGARKPAVPASRVLWIVFDELDQRLAFGERPATLPLPEFDRFRAVALYAPNAYPPARMTELSMPALFTGNLTARVEPQGSDELLLWFGDEKGRAQDEPHQWSTQPGVFGRVREAGGKAALIGWYHPYCRVLEGMTRCHWRDGPLLLGGLRRDATIPQAIYDQAMETMNTLFRLTRLGMLQERLRRERAANAQDYTALLEAGKELAADPSYSLVVVHLPAPHPIGFYDRSRREFRLDGGPSYLDNLALADRALGELRRAMELGAVGERTTVVLTSDHWWRADFWRRQPGWTPEDEAAYSGRLDHRVPLLVSFPGQQQPLVFAKPLNTVVLHDLTLAILDGGIEGAPASVGWLEVRATFGESPYNQSK
ncbi:MAG: sulfatase-like hydrolase/transferase [Terriglobales bacterium]